MYKCREPFVPILKESHVIYNKVLTGQVPNCAVPCNQTFFSPDERAHVHHLLDGPTVCALLGLHLQPGGHLPNRRGTLLLH